MTREPHSERGGGESIVTRRIKVCGGISIPAFWTRTTHHIVTLKNPVSHGQFSSSRLMYTLSYVVCGECACVSVHGTQCRYSVLAERGCAAAYIQI